MCLKIINLLCVSICSVKQYRCRFRTQYVGSSTNVDFIAFLESFRGLLFLRIGILTSRGWFSKVPRQVWKHDIYDLWTGATRVFFIDHLVSVFCGLRLIWYRSSIIKLLFDTLHVLEKMDSKGKTFAAFWCFNHGLAEDGCQKAVMCN